MDFHFHPMLADVDFGEVIAVLVFLVAGFINWVYNLWKQKREEAERGRHLPTEDEMDHHRQILGEYGRQPEPQHRQPEPAMPPPQRAPAAPAGGGGSLKDLFEELKRAAEEARRVNEPWQPEHQPKQGRPTPPPLAPPAPIHPSPAPARARVEMAPLSAKDDLGSHLEAARRAAAAYSGSREPRRAAHPLTALLHTPEGYRQAFVLKEVLDTPKGLRQSPWEDLP